MEFKKHFFVFDTSALLFDSTSLKYFSDNTIIIPVSVLQELDNHKDRLDEVGAHARAVIRELHALKQEGNLSRGVKCKESNVTIRLFEENLDHIPESLSESVVDDRILSVAIGLSNIKRNKGKVHLVTNDLNLGLKAAAYDIDAFEFRPSSKYIKTEYKGYRQLEEDEDLLIDKIYKDCKCGGFTCPPRLKAIENEYLLIKNSATEKSVRCVHRGGRLYLLKNDFKLDIEPLNNEQAYALDLLLNPKISLVTLTGPAGSGKTLVAIAAALNQTLEEKKYDKVILSRSLVVLSGKDKLGFLKGSLKEKMEPYLLPLKDAVEQILGEDMAAFEFLTGDNIGGDTSKKHKSKIEIESLQFLRGRSIRNAFFIIDEAQNLTKAEVKTIISRAGENCKIILIGDVDQIDSPYLSAKTNGLSQAIEAFKDSKIAGHICLVEGVRSELATQAAERL